MCQRQDPESIYELEIRHDNQYQMAPVNCHGNSAREAVVGPASNDQTVSNNSTRIVENSGKPLFNNCMIVSQILIAISVITCVGITSSILAQETPVDSSIEHSSIKQTITTVTRSCLDLKKSGSNKDGIYQIDTVVEDYKIDLFCDMETDGGGWTLVASIHEDNIKEKCGIKDRWATDVTPMFTGVVPKTTWENKLTFGKAQQCTIDDYKSPAYYDLNARDIMIWHIPIGTNTSNMKARSALRYRTTNHFLQSEGGNLYGLFNDRYPLTKIKRNSLELEKKRTKKVLDALYARRYTLKSKIPNWQNYEYTGNADEYRIYDSTLYSSSGGNRLYFYTPSRGYSIYYEKDYEFTHKRFVLETKRAQPFIMLSAISNEKGSASDYFRTESQSYFRTSYQNMLMENNIIFRNFQLQYRAVQYYRSSYPSVCEFHFIVLNDKEWGSLPPTSFNRTHTSSSYSSYGYSQFQVDGNAKNFVFGYLLLTRTAGYTITRTQTDAVANAVLDTLVPLKDLFYEEFPRDGLSVPITFDKGNPSTILNMIPPVFRPHVEAGYIQFRAYNLSGYPSAFCPGMRMKSFKPEYTCIGGVSGDVRENYGTCGDFAGWGGRDGDVIQTLISTGYAHSSADISSAILIFYR